MTTDGTAKQRKQGAWLVFSGALVALGGMLVPAIRDLFPFVPAATLVVTALVLLVLAPVVALGRDGRIPPGLMAAGGLLLGPCIAMLVMTGGSRPGSAVVWAAAVGGLVIAGVLRSTLRARP